MKILIVHNDYGKYSGEEAVVDKMTTMLHEHGHKVVQFRMSSKGSRDNFWGQIKGFLCGIYSPEGVKGMRLTLQREKPDVVNVHNLYPFISPAALFECKKAGVPVVMTVHNFRLICPTGLFMRSGEPCERCLEHGNEWGCVKYNCEDNFLKSVGYAARNMVARCFGAYSKCIDRFACITEFQRQKLIASGIPQEQTTLIPNSVDVPKLEEEVQIGTYIGYCGRLSREKGVDMIVDVALRHPEIPFKLAGEVRDADLVKHLPQNCELMGYLSGDNLHSFYKNARFFVMASHWYEGFPMSILESAQHGKTVVAPNHGGFTEIVGYNDNAIGRLFTPGDVDSLEHQIVTLWNNPDESRRLGLKAYEKLQKEYSSDVIYNKWNELFKEIIKHTDVKQ